MSPTVIDVRVRPPYPAIVGAGCLAQAARFASGATRVAVLTDTRVEALHGHRLQGLEAAPRLALPPGEGAKELATCERVLDFLAEAGLDRGSLLVTLGGGVVSDLGGFAASLFMRGIGVVHCPTTLLAQVDAAIGGKTAVNLRAGKNLAGTFHQPRAVIADAEVLATLDESDFRSGLGEVVKTALLGAPGLFERLERDSAALLARDPDVLTEVVVACVRLKAEVVAEDERESGPRKRLNLGHTFAHGIEHAAGFGAIPHGVAVAAGLALALACSRELGVLVDADLPERAARLLSRLGLPCTLAELRERSGVPLDARDVLSAMRRDKKARDGKLELVLPRAIGELELGLNASEALLARVLG